MRSPHYHIAKPGCQGSFAFFIRCFGSNGIEFGIVVELKFYASSLHRLPIGIYYSHCHLIGRCVMVYHVNLRIVFVTPHYLFRSVVMSENFSVHQHASGGRCVKPSQIQYRFRFASPQEIPFSVYPSLYPSMIVVGVRPARRINLSGGNGNRA